MIFLLVFDRSKQTAGKQNETYNIYYNKLKSKQLPPDGMSNHEFLVKFFIFKLKLIKLKLMGLKRKS